MLQKESKIKVLEKFYALDYTFFGKPVKEMKSCCVGTIEEYLSVKAALMSTLIEMYKLVDHKPEKLKEKVGSDKLHENARSQAKLARQISKKLVVSEKGSTDVKNTLRESLKNDNELKVSDVVEEAIREKAFKLACDHLMIAGTLSESENVGGLNEWSGLILEDSYKILRDTLIENALLILSISEE